VAIVKQVRILKKDLPSSLVQLSSTAFGYKVKYRVVSEDGSRTSAFTPLNDIVITNSSSQITVPNSISITDSAVTLYWTLPSVLTYVTEGEIERESVGELDIYVKWDNDEWQYVATTTSNTYSIIKKSGKQNVKFRGQYATSPRVFDVVTQAKPNGEKGLVLFTTESRAIGELGMTLIDGGSVV
jgi:hypothetical protein